MTGFGVRVYPTGGKVYIAQARGPDGPKRMTVGRHDVLHADQARQRAALIIARIKAGEEPVPLPLAARTNGGPTVPDLAAPDLAARYLEEHFEVKLKPNTQRQSPAACSTATSSPHSARCRSSQSSGLRSSIYSRSCATAQSRRTGPSRSCRTCTAWARAGAWCRKAAIPADWSRNIPSANASAS